MEDPRKHPFIISSEPLYSRGILPDCLAQNKQIDLSAAQEENSRQSMWKCWCNSLNNSPGTAASCVLCWRSGTTWTLWMLPSVPPTEVLLSLSAALLNLSPAAGFAQWLLSITAQPVQWLVGICPLWECCEAELCRAWWVSWPSAGVAVGLTLFRCMLSSSS